MKKSAQWPEEEADDEELPPLRVAGRAAEEEDEDEELAAGVGRLTPLKVKGRCTFLPPATTAVPLTFMDRAVMVTLAFGTLAGSVRQGVKICRCGLLLFSRSFLGEVTRRWGFLRKGLGGTHGFVVAGRRLGLLLGLGSG